MFVRTDWSGVSLLLIGMYNEYLEVVEGKVVSAVPSLTYSWLGLGTSNNQAVL